MPFQTLPEPSLDILSYIAREGPIAAQEVLNYFLVHYEEKVIKYALRRLLESGLISRIPNLLDMRSVFYRVATQTELNSILAGMPKDVSSQILSSIS